VLVAKQIVHQFDIPIGQANAALDKAEQEVRNLAEDIDIKEMLVKINQDLDGDDDEDNKKDKEEMEVELSAEDQANLDASTWPIQLVLVKVSISILEPLNKVSLIHKDDTASKDCFCNDPLNYHCIAAVVLDIGKAH
jgi:hypothetical protein